jgi:hypothetical protein
LEFHISLLSFLPQRRNDAAYSSVAPLRETFLLDPISDEHIRFTLSLCIPVRCKHELLSIGREHRKSIERVVERDPF